jgi:hypothetical protein
MSLVSRILDFLRSTAAQHPRKARLLFMLACYLALRRILTRRKSLRDQVMVITGARSYIFILCTNSFH